MAPSYLASVVAGFALPDTSGGDKGPMLWKSELEAAKIAHLSLMEALQQQEIQGFAIDRTATSNKRSKRPKRTCVVRLATHLESLEKHDPRRVFVAKRIARLGLGNGDVLREHFERFGPVVDVMLVNSPCPGMQTVATRLRPSGMAYVLMDNAADVDKILYEGGEDGQIMVGDAQVAISRFWSRAGFANHGEGTVDVAATDPTQDAYGIVSISL